MLHRITWGRGSSTAVLLHGSTSSASTWWQIGPWLAAQGWTVTALDLPAHGDSLPAGAPLTPQLAAAAVHSALAGTAVDLMIGHSFGAAVAVTLAAQHPSQVGRLVLEELPGSGSVDWAAEAESVLAGWRAARSNRTQLLQAVRREQPRWQERDCRYAVADLVRCEAGEIAAGLTQGADWLPAESLRSLPPTALLLAPDAPGVNRLEDATALRGADRSAVCAALAVEPVIIPAGHCLHRDDPRAWMQGVATQLTIRSNRL